MTQAEFDAAQSTRTLLKGRDGSIASQALLGGLARCASCGHTLKVTGNTEKSTGRRYAVYYCAGRYAKGNCESRATIRASYLDDFVERSVLAALTDAGSVLASALESNEAAESAARQVEAAAHELDLYLQADLITVVGADAFRAGVETRQALLDQARAGLAALQATTIFTDDLLPTDLLQAWPELETAEKRSIMHGLLDRVDLQRDPTLGRNAAPIEQRVGIVVRGRMML